MTIGEINRVRLLDWMIEYGASGRDGERGRNHRLNNQYATGKISRHTHRLLLGVNERLSAGPHSHNPIQLKVRMSTPNGRLEGTAD